mgnify:CR=1 FL=1
MNALKDKEIWINMIGGTNQINIALLTAGSFSAVAARYYYIFQSDNLLLHPEIDKPSLKNPSSSTSLLLERWHELPIFHLDIGAIIKRISRLFEEKDIAGVKEVEEILEELGYHRGYMAKIRNRIVRLEGNRAYKGYMLTQLSEMVSAVEKEGVDNFSKWKRWGKEEKILWELTLDGRITN